MRVAVLGSTGGWHAGRLERALTARGHACEFAQVTRIVGGIDGGIKVRGGEVPLDACDVVVVRGIPRGSLEQIVFRVDALHALAAAGVGTVNSAAAIERTVDKFLASALLAAAGVPTPRTVACERAEDALEAFADLGSDVIVKPLFGSMGFGMARVEDPDVAQRVFRALEIERAVYYLQETLPHDGVDIRALVVGERVIAAIERVGPGWRMNLARGARARPIALDEDRAQACVRAAAALGADYAGVDLLRAADGREYVIEVNGIPGWRGVEEATGVDVAAALVEHLERAA
jgi:RimK family alpha-L-glutamate ligase